MTDRGCSQKDEEISPAAEFIEGRSGPFSIHPGIGTQHHVGQKQRVHHERKGGDLVVAKAPKMQLCPTDERESSNEQEIVAGFRKRNPGYDQQPQDRKNEETGLDSLAEPLLLAFLQGFDNEPVVFVLFRCIVAWVKKSENA